MKIFFLSALLFLIPKASTAATQVYIPSTTTYHNYAINVETGTIRQFTCSTCTMTRAIITSATITNLNISTANINSPLVVSTLTVTSSFTAVNANITNLTVVNSTITRLNVTTGTITNFTANSVTATIAGITDLRTSTITLNTDLVRGTTNANTLTLPNQVMSAGSFVSTSGTQTVSGQLRVKVGSNTATDVANYSQMQILQTIVAFTNSSSSATTSIAFVPTLLTTSITPTSASSRILIMVNGTMTANSTTVSRQGFATLERGTTDLSSGSLGFCSASTLVTSATADNDYPCSMIFVDSPATTSATTYTVYIRTSNAADSTVWNRNSRISTITLMEIR